MRAYGNLTEGIIATLRTNGPLSQQQIADALGVTRHAISSAIRRLGSCAGGRRSAPKRIYAQRWVYGLPGFKNHLRPIWALGSLPDAPKPPTKESSAFRLARKRAAVVRSEPRIES